jgi:hypothetical protein
MTEIVQTEHSQIIDTLPPTEIIFDFGSSTIKDLIPTPNGFLSDIYRYEAELITPTTYPDIDLGTNKVLKVIRDEELDKIKTFIHDETTGKIDSLNITSAKKPLYVWKRNEDGSLKEILFINDPTLKVDLTKEEDVLIRETLHLTKTIDTNNPLIQALALQKLPTLIEKLFGENTVFDDLHFGTLTTFIRRTITQEENPKVGKNYTLAFGMNGCREDDVKALVTKLGIKNYQLDFENEGTIQVEGMNISEKDDFRVEMDLVDTCVLEGLVSPNTVFFGGDSVGKVAVHASAIGEKPWGNFDQYKKVKYRTQRTMGNANNWLKALVAQMQGLEGLAPEGRIDKILQTANPTAEWFFDPLANDEDGGLYHKQNGYFVEVKRNELEGLKYFDDLEGIVAAVSWGASASIRDLFPDDSILKYDTIDIYGGLVATYDYGPNLGWRRVLRSVMAKDKRIELFGIESAAIAMWLVYCIENGKYVDLRKMVSVQPISGDENDTNGLDVYYSEWKNWQQLYQDKVIAQALLGS